MCALGPTCRIMIAGLLLAAASVATAAENNNVCFHLRTGEKIVFTHSNHPVLAFGKNNEAIIKAGYKEVSTYSYDKLHKITFGSVSGIGDALVDANGELINLGPKDFALVGFETGAPIAVVNASGVLMLSAVIEDSAAHRLSLADMAKGIYIVTVGSQSFKIAIK